TTPNEREARFNLKCPFIALPDVPPSTRILVTLHSSSSDGAPVIAWCNVACVNYLGAFVHGKVTVRMFLNPKPLSCTSPNVSKESVPTLVLDLDSDGGHVVGPLPDAQSMPN